MTKDQPLMLIFGWVVALMAVVPDALDKILWRDMFSLEVSVVGETDHPTKLLVKHQGEILSSIVYSRLMVHRGRKPLPDHKKCSGPSTSRLMWTYWNFHSMPWRKNDFATLKSFPSNIYQDHPKGLIYDQMMLIPQWPNFQCFYLFCGWGTPSVWKVHFRKHLPCRKECSLGSMHSSDKCQHTF